MQGEERIDSADRALVQIVDAALAGAVRVSGTRLACRPGCSDCCMGAFPITQLDARRLASGLAEMQASDPARAAAIRRRARLAAESPQEDDEPCPALDPETGLCELYAARPITCRIFGPPMRTGGGPVGVCELCFQGCAEEEIAACVTEVPGGSLEEELLSSIQAETGLRGETSVALALLS